MDKICFGNITFDDYGCPKGYCIITNKTSFMDDVTWAKVVGIFISNITKMELYALIFICCDTCYPPPPFKNPFLKGLPRIVVANGM